MGAPRQICPPAQLNLFPSDPLVEGTSAPESSPASVPTSHPRWRKGHRDVLSIGGHSVAQWLRESDEGWILDLAGWIERRVLEALSRDSASDTFPRELFTPAKRGTCPRSPVALVTLVLVGTLRGITSLRGLERFARMDLRGIWILGGWCPDHSTLGRFLERLHGKVSEQLFERLTVEALRAVGKRVCDVSFDGTVVCAVASRDGRLHADVVAERLERATRRAATTPDDVKGKEELERAEACARAWAARQKTHQEMGRDPSSLTVGPSEPEAVTHKT